MYLSNHSKTCYIGFVHLSFDFVLLCFCSINIDINDAYLDYKQENVRKHGLTEHSTVGIRQSLW